MFSTILTSSHPSRTQRALLIAVFIALAFTVGVAARRLSSPTGAVSATRGALLYPLLGPPFLHVLGSR